MVWTGAVIRTVYIELSPTPIYRRIAQALGAELMRQGVEVLAVKPEGFDSNSFARFIGQAGGAGVAYVSSALSNTIQLRRPGTDTYYFEGFAGPVIFVHQDAILGGLDVLAGISRLQAWRRISARSAHLCIEADNVADLASVGITHTQRVAHASETVATEPLRDGFAHAASFVGHAVPSGSHVPDTDSLQLQQLLADAMRARREDFSTPLEPMVKAYADRALEGLGTVADQAVLRVAQAQWLRSRITSLTLPLRGWMFEHCGLDALDIFGGDPAYLHGIDRQLQVERPGVFYHPAEYAPEGLQRIYQRSRVSLNLSSLQFDYAVVNRFHDVFMSGGLCLTDSRSGLAELTSLHAEVSYRTVEELHERALHFARPEHARERALLIEAIQQDVARHSGYEQLVRAIVRALQGL